MSGTLRRTPLVGVVGVVCLLLVALVIITGSLLWGRYPMDVTDVWAALTSSHGDPTIHRIVTEIRLPRITAALLIGMALSVAGTVYQGMFRNPLVSPDLLGASAGAGFGASLAIILGIGLFGLQFLAFGFGLVAVLLAWLVSTHMRRDPLLGLILAGIVISAVFSAGTSFLKYVADPTEQLPAITFWLMGGLNGVSSDQLGPLAVIIGVCVAVLWLLSWRLNVISFSDESARTLGVDVKVVRAIVVVTATLMTTASVSVGGLISWVGLVVPHLVRLAVGPDFRRLIPLAAVVGGLFLLADEGYLVVVSSHNPMHALLHASRVLLLKQGRLVGDTTAAALGEDDLSHLYDIPVRLLEARDEPGVRLCLPASSAGRTKGRFHDPD